MLQSKKPNYGSFSCSSTQQVHTIGLCIVRKSMQIHFKIALLIQTNLHIVQILYFSICTVQFKFFLYYAKQKYSRTYCMYVYVYLDRKCPVNTCGKLENPKFFILILFSDCLFFWRFNVSKLCSKYFGWLLLSNGNKKYHFSPQCMLCSMYEKFETCNL